MLKKFIRTLTGIGLLVASVANAVEIDGAPTGTKAIPFRIESKDPNFVGVVSVGVRELTNHEEVIVGFRVVGFSMNISAGFGETLESAREISFYNPAWHAPDETFGPEFVWWESDAATSYHILKVKHEYTQQSANSNTLRIRYHADDGADSDLIISLN